MYKVMVVSVRKWTIRNLMCFIIRTVLVFFSKSMNVTFNISRPHYIFEDDYTGNWIGFLCFTGIRYLEMIIGIIGNGMTLNIIRNRKVLTNGHIFIMYLAIADLFVCSTVPLTTYTALSRSFKHSWRYWKTLCRVKEYILKSAAGFSILCYSTMSVNR